MSYKKKFTYRSLWSAFGVLALSLTLYSLGFYSMILIVLFFYILSLFKSKLTFFMFLFSLNYALLLIFTSAEYLFYFINLFIIVVGLYLKNLSFKRVDFLLLVLFAIFTILVLRYFDDMVYEVYIFSTIKDTSNLLSDDVDLMLSFLHLFLFYNLSFKYKHYIGTIS